MSSSQHPHPGTSPHPEESISESSGSQTGLEVITSASDCRMAALLTFTLTLVLGTSPVGRPLHHFLPKQRPGCPGKEPLHSSHSPSPTVQEFPQENLHGLDDTPLEAKETRDLLGVSPAFVSLFPGPLLPMLFSAPHQPIRTIPRMVLP